MKNSSSRKKKVPVGILGATGMVGQRYIQILKNHPWFEIVYLAASPASAGMKYVDAIKGRWHMNEPVPKDIGGMRVEDVSDAGAAAQCRIVFSAFEAGGKETVRTLEEAYAARGIAVFSNSSAHRATPDVPVLIPEINPEHLDILPAQKTARKWKNGFIVVKPNCSLQSYLLPIYALIQAGFEVTEIIVTTMQAVSGAGHPGVSSLDITDNVIPYISGEEEKTEQEPLKILGRVKTKKIELESEIRISAHCNRVPVIDGHTACVSVAFGKRKPTHEEIIKIWREFRGEPQKLNLPSAPAQPIVYHEESDRPQPRRDRDDQNGMSISVGRLRKCAVLDYKFVGLSHNTVRGAAGGGILNAELAVAKGLVVDMPERHP